MEAAPLDPIGPHTVSEVTAVLGPERAALLALLADLDPADWDAPTECPSYPVKGIATHILGDDLSLLSRQRDGAPPGLLLHAEHHPGLDFRALLDGFNDHWVEAARFLSSPLLIELLRLAGEWTEAFYAAIDPEAPGEPVPMFQPPPGAGSPSWQAIAREYLERWAHHAQILRALGRPSPADAPFLETAARIVATAAETTATVTDARVTIGPLDLGARGQAADILTLAHTEDEVRALVAGPAEAIADFAARVHRRPS